MTRLFTKEIREKLVQNGTRQKEARGTKDEFDFQPVVKIFTPDANCTWLLTEIDPDDTDIAFGLCDLGLGCPELGNVSLLELQALRGRLGLPVERDRHFKAKHPLSVYANAASTAGQITTSKSALEQATPTKYEVQQYTLCDGWINTWRICEDDGTETKQVFDTEAEAQAELDEFFREIEEEIAYGERDPEDGFDRAEFRIVPVGKGGES